MSEKPWIILTLRRTGGTELTSALARLSAFRTIEHEPFNPGRKLGAITERLSRHHNPAQMRAEMDAALESRPNIKHCVEVLPLAITRALVDAAQALEYHIILLTRRDEAKRIGSLLLAQATGAWGSVEAARIYPRIVAGEVRPAAIDLDRLPQRVDADFAALGRVLTLLRNRGMTWDWQVFEEIYHSARSPAEQVIAIARRAGINAAPDDPRLSDFLRGTGQNSAGIAAHVPNFAEAQARLDMLCAS